MRRLFTTIFLLLLLTACTRQISRPLKPERIVPQLADGVVLNEAVELTFAQLANTPDAFENRLIRASGTYLPFSASSVCPQNKIAKGLIPRWGMIADGLQMNAVGFEHVVPLIAEGETLVVDGVWHKYIGPVGCGKEPQAQVVYYLDVVQILQPNPIIRLGDSSVVNEGKPLAEPDLAVVDEVPVDSVDIDQVEPTQLVAPPVDTAQPTATRDLTPPTPTPASNSQRPTQVPVQAPPVQQATVAVAAPTRTPFSPTAAPQATATVTRTPLPTSEPRQKTATPVPTTSAETETSTPDPDVDVTNTPVADETSTPELTPTEVSTTDPEATETLTPTVDPEATATSTPDPDLPTVTATADAVGTAIPTPGTPVSETSTPTAYPGQPTETPYP